MSRKVTTILAVLLILVGVGIMAYPAISNYVNEINGSYAIQELTEQMEKVDSEEIIEQRQRAEAYNEKLSDVQITDIFDTSSNQVSDDDEYYEIMDFAQDIMGYIQIPSIDVKLPIYHGTSAEVLAKGVGHLPQSAFPIGGEGNHSVLTGHTGLPSAELFTDIIKLKEGDYFYIHILNRVLAYQVDQIKVVLPEETEELLPVAGKDYCTLVTCTPYGINSHRLLVRGERVELNLEEEEVLKEELKDNTISKELILIIAILALVLLVVIVLIVKKKRKNIRKLK